MKLRYLLWAGVALAVVALVWSLRPQPTTVDVARVERGPLQVFLAEEGETRVRHRYEVTAPVDGRLRRVLLEAGDSVVAEETVVATLEPAAPTPLDARARAEARAELRAAQAELEEQQAQRERVASELAFARDERERYARLVADQVVSQERYEEVELEAQRVTLSARAAEHAVASARSRVAAARARLGFDRRSADEGIVEIRSPITGVVLRRHRESAATVRAGEPLLDLGDASDLELVADFLSSEAVRIRPGQEVVIEDWGGDQPLVGRVQRVEPSAFLKISALGVEEQRVNVVVDLSGSTEDRRGLADGFRVQVKVVVWEQDNVLTVPTGALVRRGEEWSVFVVADGESQRRIATLGQRTADRAEVLTGLEEGEEVILYPGATINDGVAVAPQSS
ncbi:MAG: efflux RND transporter periplasmic adaptor subunit [Acidobacteriota bacterium]